MWLLHFKVFIPQKVLVIILQYVFLVKPTLDVTARWTEKHNCTEPGSGTLIGPGGSRNIERGLLCLEGSGRCSRVSGLHAQGSARAARISSSALPLYAVRHSSNLWLDVMGEYNRQLALHAEVLTLPPSLLCPSTKQLLETRGLYLSLPMPHAYELPLQGPRLCRGDGDSKTSVPAASLPGLTPSIPSGENRGRLQA